MYWTSQISSHEARNPCSALASAAELLRTKTVDHLGRISLGQSIIVTKEMLSGLEDDVLILESTCSRAHAWFDAVLAHFAFRRFLSSSGMQHCTSMQERILNDVLRLSQIDLGLLDISFVELDIVEEVERLCRIFTVRSPLLSRF